MISINRAVRLFAPQRMTCLAGDPFRSRQVGKMGVGGLDLTRGVGAEIAAAGGEVDFSGCAAGLSRRVPCRKSMSSRTRPRTPAKRPGSSAAAGPWALVGAAASALMGGTRTQSSGQSQGIFSRPGNSTHAKRANDRWRTPLRRSAANYRGQRQFFVDDRPYPCNPNLAIYPVRLTWRVGFG